MTPKLLLSVMIFLSACASQKTAPPPVLPPAPTLYYYELEPIPQPGQQLMYNEGRPIIVATGRNAEITVSPRGEKYDDGDKIGFLVGITNTSDRPVNFGAGNLSISASGKPINLEPEPDHTNDIAASQAYLINQSRSVGVWQRLLENKFPVSGVANTLDRWREQDEIRQHAKDQIARQDAGLKMQTVPPHQSYGGAARLTEGLPGTDNGEIELTVHAAGETHILRFIQHRRAYR